MIKYSVILFCFFYAPCIIGQEPIRFTIDNGLPSNHIYEIAQDSDGFMWFASNRGLTKFDGYDFKTFSIKNGLPNNDIWGIEADDKGRIWYTTKSKFQGYILQDSVYKFATKDSLNINPFISYYNNGKMQIYASNTIINNDKREKIYYQIDNNIITPKKSLSIDFIQLLKKHPQFDHSHPYYELSNDLILLVSDKYHVIDNKLNTINSIEFKDSGESEAYLGFHNKFRAINDRYIIRQRQKGLSIIDIKDISLKYYSYNDLIGIEKFDYYKTRVTPKGLQLSCSGYLMEFDHQLEFIKYHKFSNSIQNHCSFKDNNNNIWLADVSAGVTMLPNLYQKTKYYFKEKLVDKLSIINNTLYAGVQDDYFYEFDSKSKKFKKLAKSLAKIYSIKKYRNNIIFNSYAKSYVKKENQITRKAYNSNFISEEKIIQYKGVSTVNHYDYIVDASSFFEYDNHKKEFTNLVSASGLTTIDTYRDTIFVAGSQGILQYKNRKLLPLKMNGKQFNHPINAIKSINDLLFIGTDGLGLYTFNGKNIVFINSTKELMIKNIISHNDHIWIATQEGVKQIKININNIKASKIVNSFYTEDGFLDNNINDIAFLDSTLFVASNRGISSIKYNSKIYNQKPKLYTKQISDTLKVDYNSKKPITIAFSVQDYTQSDHIQYFYKIEPKQNKWIQTKTKELNFTNLTPGKYTISLKAVNHHQRQTIKDIQLIITPLWYQTTFFKISMLVVIVLVITLILKYINQYKTENSLLEIKIKKKEIETELQALRAQMNPIFIQNSLEAIIYFLKINNVSLSEEYLIKFSKMVRHFFDYAKNQFITIEEEINLLENYLQIEKIRLKEAFDYNFIIDASLESERFNIPSMLLQPIIETILNNTTFSSIEKKEVKIHIYPIDQNIHIDIKYLILQNTNENSADHFDIKQIINLINQKIKLLNKGDYHNVKFINKNINNKNGNSGILFSFLLNNQ